MSRAAIKTASALLRVSTATVAPITIRNVARASGVITSGKQFHTSPSTLRSTTNTISVDPRILDGTSGFLPKENVDRLTEWQTGLWDRLAAEVRNNPDLKEVKKKWDDSGLDITHLLHFTAKDPKLSLAFNYASALINNSYFLEGINPSDPQLLPLFVEKNAEALKAKAEAYADGIMGGAWLWLVRTGSNNSDLDIVPTFGSGTLLITQRAQIGRDNIPLYGTPNSSSYSSLDPPSPEVESISSSSSSSEIVSPPMNPASLQREKRSSGTDKPNQYRPLPYPLAVLNLHEMAYLGSKYGVWDRRRYAGDWFDSLDWSRVGARGKVTG